MINMNDVWGTQSTGTARNLYAPEGDGGWELPVPPGPVPPEPGPEPSGFSCSICKRLFPDQAALDAHMKSVHPKPPVQLSCSICGKLFPDQAALDAHMQSAHRKEEDWEDPWTIPEWMSPHAYKWTDWRTPQIATNVKQTWFRDPGVTASLVWNPYWGWQHFTDIENIYKSATGPVTNEQFKAWGLTPHPGANWRAYYKSEWDGEETTPTTPTTPAAPAAPTTDWGGIFQDYLGGLGEYQYPPTEAQYQYPPELDIAAQTMTRFAEGYPTELPPEYEEAIRLALQMAQTGEPVSQQDWYAQKRGIAETDIRKQIAQAAETAGVQGLRQSTVLASQAAQIAGEIMARAGLEWTEREQTAAESALGRKMQAIPMVAQFAQTPIGLAEAGKERAMAAATGLGGLAQLRAQLPLTAAEQAMQMGMTEQQARQDQINRIYSEFMRQVPEASPWLQQAMSAVGMPSQVESTTYQPSAFTSILGVLPSIAKIAPMLCKAAPALGFV